MMKRSTIAVVSVVVAVLIAGNVGADWNTLVIRNGTSGPPAILDNTDYAQPAKEFVIAESGQKAAWGTSDLDGHTVGDIAQLVIARLDDRTRFDAGSGPYVAPYFNIWVYNGNPADPKYAVIANEPSDGAFQPLYDGGYDLSWADIADKVVKVYENDDKSWLPGGGAVGQTFADYAGVLIQAPTVAQLTTGWPGLGGGAPRELGTNVAYGFNWVFGDTLSHYVSGAEGYVVNNPAQWEQDTNNPHNVGAR